MSQTRILVVLLALLGIGAVVAWFVVGEDKTKPVGPQVSAVHYDDDADDSARPAPVRRDPRDVQLSEEQREELAQERAEAQARAEAEQREAENRGNSGNTDTPQGDNRRQGGNRQGGAQGSGDTQQGEQRRLTPQEREEQRRVERGRPELQQRLARTPSAVATATGLQKTPEQEAWEEEWNQQGITPPKMIPTPVSGKIMSRQAREGLAEAQVHLMTFFPLDGIAGGPLLPVVTTLTTDDKGEFKGEIPGPELAPQGYPIAAVGVSWQGHRILTAQPVTKLDVGINNAIGIFWAPDYPYQLECNASQFNGTLRVVSTGELNPQRIHPQKQAEFLNSFPSFNVIPNDAEHVAGMPSPGETILTGTWGRSVRPFINLLRGDTLLKTQIPAPRTIVGDDSPPAELPFDTLVFENEAYRPISGVVVNAEGMAVGGAVVVTVGPEITQSVVTDSSGWFFLETPHDDTTALRCYHDDYIEVIKTGVEPGYMNVQIILQHRRPRVHLEIRDRINGQPINSMGFRVIGLHPHGPNAGKPMPEGFTEMTSSDGRYVLEWEYEIQSIALERIGYFPRTITSPVAAADDAGGLLAVNLSPGRELVVIPREYTEARDPSRWYPDPQNGPGIRTNWAQQWIEWEVDFGDEPEEGEEGGYYDLLLGCTNYGLVDNQYEFTIRVYVDGEFKGILEIPGDSVNVRTGRISLGKLSGAKRVRLNWTNDQWIPDQLDANVRYASMQFIEQPGPPQD